MRFHHLGLSSACRASSLALLVPLLLALLVPAVVAAESIVVVKNSDHPRYETPLRALRVRLGDKVVVRQLDLTDMDLAAAQRNAKALMQSNPKAVVALGDKAAFLASRHMGPAPVWFGMVNAWRDLGLDTVRVGGVSMYLSPENLMSQIKIFLPKVRRIGVIYSGGSRAFVEAAMLRAANLQLTMLPIYIDSAEEFPQIFEAIGGTLDAFWVVEDPVVATKENLKALIDEAERLQLPTISYSVGLVEAGLTMAITADGEAVGGQLADRVLALADGQQVDAAVVPPAKARITLNRKHLTTFGLEVDPMLLSFATLVGGEGRAPRR